MSSVQRIGNQQLLQEAEGYLDLVTALSGPFAPDAQSTQRLAIRALRTLDELEHRTDRRSHWLNLRGRAYRLLERFHEAAVAFEEATEFDPFNLHLWIELGNCHRQCGRLDLAVHALEEALMIDSGEARVHFNLARYWSLGNSPKMAVAYLAKALDIDPGIRDQIPTELDFDPIRHHPDFAALTRVAA